MKKQFKEKQKGITLIALVITIIVLLILAGVGIAMLTGESGILNKAQTAKDKNLSEGELERIKLAASSSLIEGDGKITRDILAKELKKNGLEISEKNLTGEGPYYYTNEDNLVYEIDIKGEIKRSNRKSTLKIAFFGENTYNERPILDLMEEVTLEQIEVENSQLKITGDMGEVPDLGLEEGIQTYTLNIKKNEELNTDYLDIGPVLGYPIEVPALLVDSNWNLCKELTGKINIDDYYLIGITDESQVGILLSGEYYTSYSFWMSGWEEEYELTKEQIIGRNEIYFDACFYTVMENGKVSYETYYLEDNFEETDKLVKNIKNMNGVKIERIDGGEKISYEDTEIISIHSFFYEGKPILKQNGSDFSYDTYRGNEIYLYTIVLGYDMFPAAIRNKETHENVDVQEFAQNVHALFRLETEDGNKEANELIKSHEYYWEEKYYAMDMGKAIQ